MGKQHDTIPNEPQEAPVRPDHPEVQQPGDPQGPPIPQEAPQNEPLEIPREPAPQPEIKPDQPGSLLNQTEV
ncbi:MAG: hypothetical protein ACTHNW_04420 [Mucilaginibacter sp.]